jgi:hypothetical protein
MAHAGPSLDSASPWSTKRRRATDATRIKKFLVIWCSRNVRLNTKNRITTHPQMQCIKYKILVSIYDLHGCDVTILKGTLVRHTKACPIKSIMHTYNSFFFFEKHSRRSHTRAYTHPYERTHAHPTPMSTSGRPSRRIGSWNWRSHHRRLAVDGNVASHW